MTARKEKSGRSLVDLVVELEVQAPLLLVGALHQRLDGGQELLPLVLLGAEDHVDADVLGGHQRHGCFRTDGVSAQTQRYLYKKRRARKLVFSSYVMGMFSILLFNVRIAHKGAGGVCVCVCV